MAVPKRRTSRSRRNHRRSHDGVRPVQVQYCPQCNEPVLSHRACPHCGYYQGRTAIPMAAEETTRK
ncbi:MAG: 50S ribosomal protein L32 [Thermogemmata sp.]|mgnify:FL=1|jgi:large subunit ribosomal protein L32|uniref:Large ribosomal subunit protein bL32 n=1 Tax=Thermogemmata fonticola TaxID=2755323 RepID=A0A7V8VF73_9BACT|nr:50S ribosomal protein L32 [Thermogemmata fonticola]MBA2226861.1 50S ribosomal protein L32 [Thermogemmata fonticola]MCX8139426.1 50S ribosomal protein L32 [Gemmataceae bacterium]